MHRESDHKTAIPGSMREIDAALEKNSIDAQDDSLCSLDIAIKRLTLVFAKRLTEVLPLEEIRTLHPAVVRALGELYRAIRYLPDGVLQTLFDDPNGIVLLEKLVRETASKQAK